MKKIVLAVTIIAAVAGAAMVGQATAKQLPSCFCTPQFGCSCMDV